MSETVSLEFIGHTLRTIQAEQRSIRDENRLIRSALSDAITLLMQRIGTFEALMETRLDQMTAANGVLATFMAEITRKLDALHDPR
jgi:pyrroline-5-carboxylate reductase